MSLALGILKAIVPRALRTFFVITNLLKMEKSDIKKILGYLYAKKLLKEEMNHEELSDLILSSINFSERCSQL